MRRATATFCLAIFAVYLATPYIEGLDEVYESEDLQHDERTVLIGALFPMHYHNNKSINCGAFHKEAVQKVEALVHAINVINDNTTLLPNIKLKFTVRDTCSSPSHGLEQAFHFVQRSNSDSSCLRQNYSNAVAVSGVLGGYFSRVSIDLANLLRLYKLPQISYVSSADVLGDKERFDYFFRTVPPDSLQSTAITDIIVHFKWTFVFALNSDDTYGNGGINALIELLSKTNPPICVAEKITFAVTATRQDYDAAVQKMSKNYVKNATVAVLFGHIEAATGIMKAIQRQFNSSNYALRDVTWIGTDSWGDSLPKKYRNIPGTVLGLLQRAVKYPTFDNYYLSLSPDNYSRNIWFNELWENKFGCSLTNVSCGRLTDTMTLNDSSYKQVNHLTLISDTVNAFAHAIHALVQKHCHNNILCDAILEDRALGKSVNGELLRDALYNISYTGDSSNEVYFDREGENKGSYFIKNLKKSGNSYFFETIGVWDHRHSLTFTSPIYWPSDRDNPFPSVCSEPCSNGHEPIPTAVLDCCWYCSPCSGETEFSNGTTSCQECPPEMMPTENKSGCLAIPIRHLTISSGWSITMLVLSVIGLLATLSVALIFIAFYKHRAIKASSREVSIILLVGLVLCFFMPFFFIAKPSAAVCAIRRFGIGLGFTICFSALLVKTNRIYRMFNQKTLNPAKPPQFTSPLAQIIMTLALISVQLLVATVWTAADPPSATAKYKGLQAELVCNGSPILYITVSLGYSFVLLILSTYNAFLARKVPENFNEARYINATLYALCVIWLAFVAIYFATLNLGAMYQAISLMVAIFLSASATLVCIFVPRIILLITMLLKNEKQTG